MLARAALARSIAGPAINVVRRRARPEDRPHNVEVPRIVAAA
jgi:hypothetical protein